MADELELDSAGVAEELIAAPADLPTPCQFRCGVAGTGKTFGVMRDMAADSSFGVLAATTGIAAVNLGAITINSLLNYFDTRSLRDAYLCGRLAKDIHHKLRGRRWLAIDEGSMLGAPALGILYRGVRDANLYDDIKTPIGLMIIGDFAQLPPINEPFAFESEFWYHFQENTVRLDKVWRQDNGVFLDAINLIRSGHGGPAAEILTAAGVRWHTARDSDYEGTTIVPVNKLVSNHNDVALDRVPGKRFRATSRRWGKQRPEWGESKRTHEWGIPPSSDYKIGAYVMILSNDTPDFNYVNGDCGWIEQYDADAGSFTVRLKRNDNNVFIKRIVRACDQQDEPEDWQGETVTGEDDTSGWKPFPHLRKKTGRYVLGQIEYFPMRLGYASTVHKSQGLTLDMCQVDFRHWFFTQPSMLYVAISRVRTLAGLRLVGGKDRFIQACNVDPRVKEWL